jgi:RimJ/RimL family protein N-acetyltransferase
MSVAREIDTERLRLRRPRVEDAGEIFSRYAADPSVTRYLAWPCHRSLADTRAFLAFSESEWARWPAGPLLIHSRSDGTLLGSTGLTFETATRAMTGYLLAQDAWGKGYACEALHAIVGLAAQCRVRRLYAVCHTEHKASARVLEKCGFLHEGILHSYMEFPNLGADGPSDVHCYALLL